MSLLDAKTNEKYVVYKIIEEDNIKNRLLAFGIIKGTKIIVLNRRFNNALIVKIRGTRLGISGKIAGKIFIKEEKLEKNSNFNLLCKRKK